MENHHAPIVPKEIYRQVQGELKRRGSLKEKAAKIRFGSEEALMGRIICGRCGNTLKRYEKPSMSEKWTDTGKGDVQNISKMNEPEVEWRCRNRSYTKKTRGKNRPSPCGCRFVPEEEVKQAILDAINELPEHRDELLRKQGELERGEIKRIDALMDRSKEAEKLLEERRTLLEENDLEGNASEIGFLTRQIRQEQENQSALLMERAEYSHQGIQIRSLLEIVDGIRKQGGGDIRKQSMEDARKQSEEGTQTAAGEDNEENALPVGSCEDVEEFFRLTRFRIPEEALDQEGRMAVFQDLAIVRCLDHVTVLDDGYEISFKGGITIPMSQNQLKLNRCRGILRF